MNRLWQACLILFIWVAVAVPLRWADLAQRPFHADESVQAMKFRTLWKTGEYRYNPHEFHGPLLHYVSLPFQWISGQDIDAEKESILRSVPAFFSLLGILILLAFHNALGRSGLIMGALLLTVSPSLLFYNRYFIHETLLFTFTLLFLAAGWQYSQSKRRRWILTAGIALGLMYATKETFVLNLAAALGGLALVLAMEKFRGNATLFLKKIPLTHWLLALCGAMVTGIVLFTSFFTNAGGLMDSVRTYMPWLGRAGGDSPHIWPWYYYLQRYFWFSKDGGPLFTEAFILLPALLGAWSGFKDHFPAPIRRLSLFLTGYTLLLAVLYSSIPYKTPWCFMCVMQGLILLAALGVSYLFSFWRNGVSRALATLILIAGSVHLLGQANQLNNKYYEESKNPHVYAHTVSDLRGLVRTVEKLGSIHPQGKKMIIQVITTQSDCWPLPWYLRTFENTTGWYGEVPEDVIGSVLIFSPKFSGQIKEKVGSTYQYAGFYGFRPNVFLQVYVEKSLWSQYLAKGLALEEEDEDEE